MATSLYDLTVQNYLQILDAMDGILDKGSAWCAEQGRDPDTLLELRLAEDMFPLTFQLHMAETHSRGTITGIREGIFAPPRSVPELDYAGYRQHLAAAASDLRALDADDVNGLAGKHMTFVIGEMQLPFTAENFVMSFSLPNFYFHTTAAYALLRAEGVALGKRDYLGQMRMGQ